MVANVPGHLVAESVDTVFRAGSLERKDSLYPLRQAMWWGVMQQMTAVDS